MVSLFSNARRGVGGCIVLIGFILIIPSILLWLLSGVVYGSPIYDQNVSVPLDGSVKSVQFDNTFVAGNNYNIRISFKTVGAPVNPVSRAHYIMNATSTPSTFASGLNGPDGGLEMLVENFNGTDDYSWADFDYPDNFVSNVSLTLNFHLDGAVIQVSSAIVTIKIFQNPNRPLYNLLNTIGLILAIPGFIVIVCGACVAGNSGKSSGSSRGASFKRRSSR